MGRGLHGIGSAIGRSLSITGPIGQGLQVTSYVSGIVRPDCRCWATGWGAGNRPAGCMGWGMGGQGEERTRKAAAAAAAEAAEAGGGGGGGLRCSIAW